MLIDTYDRVATDLRVSLTDKCNLRCTYCMPEEGLQWLGKSELLSDDPRSCASSASAPSPRSRHRLPEVRVHRRRACCSAGQETGGVSG
ncbi:GTP 3',8-cyclase [Streptomyces californicus]